MKFKCIIDPDCEEEVVVHARERSPLVEKLEKLVVGEALDPVGYDGSRIVPFRLCDVYCFFVEGGRVFALLENERLLMKQRLYAIESGLGSDFVRINQSAIVRLDKIECFDASLSGTLTVLLKNGHRDYVSRRQLKTVKERIGL